jgi:hypothetical protein
LELLKTVYNYQKIQANRNISIKQGSAIQLHIQRIASLKMYASKTALAELDSFDQ